MKLKNILKSLFIFILVCKVFSWGEEGPDNVTPEINKWLKHKRYVDMKQTTVNAGSISCYREITYLTIIVNEVPL